MPNPNNFDEASAATEELFASEQLSLADVPPANSDTPPVEDGQAAENSPATDAEGNPPAENQNGTGEPPATPPETSENQSALDEAAHTAEVAAQVATEKDGQLRQALAENEALKEQLKQMQGTIDSISQKNAETLVADALKPPTLNINELAFADDEAQNAAMAKYAEEMSAYNRQQLMKEMSPAIEFAKKGMYDAEKSDVVAALSQIPELANIKEMLPQLDRIIEKNKWLQSEDMPMDERYINAYAMARGIDIINNPPAQAEQPKEPTPEELLSIYNNNPAFQELVEKQRVEAVKQSQQVPPFSASSGAVNAALNIKDKPQTLEEASRRTREMFGA